MAPSPTPRQLSDGDAIFLSMETPEAGGHVGGLMILEAREGFDFDTVAAHIAERMALVPRFSWRLHSFPMDLDRPYWIEAEDFDAREHVIRTAIPAPGTLQQLSALAGRLHAQPLDRSRPLWEVWCIEGVADGKVGVYMKTHHCLLDGMGGAGLAEVLADLTPDAAAPPIIPEAFLEESPARPSAFHQLARAVSNGAARPGRLASHLHRGMRDVVRGLRGGSESSDGGEVARLSFNRSVGRRRALASTSLELSRVLDLKKHFDVKVNDVVLEIVGSAVRRWLRDRGETPEQPLVAMCPVSTREESDQELGNKVTSMVVPLASDRSDPVERLRLIHASAQRAKQGVETGSFDWTAAVGESFAPAFVNWMVSAANLAGDTAPLPANFVVSNVRATPIPLYIAGSRVETLMPMSILQAGQGLNVTLVSYCGRIDVGITADPDLVPDLWELAEKIPRALEELESAAEGVVHRTR